MMPIFSEVTQKCQLVYLISAVTWY